MTKHVMIDIETMGTRPHAVVLSLGAVWFDAEGTYEKFYAVLDRTAQEKLGRTTDKATAEWWAQQSPAARAVFDAPQEDLNDALRRFSSFLQIYPLDGMWGNGADFDNVILGTLAEQAGFGRLWKFYRNRCHRTLKNLYPAIVRPPTLNTAHHALDDAVNQAEHAAGILQHIRDLGHARLYADVL